MIAQPHATRSLAMVNIIRANGRAAPLLALLAALGWSGTAVSADVPAPQSRPPADTRQQGSSWCLAKCDELEGACKEFENRYPSCSPADICLDEKLQCEATCRPRVKLGRTARLSCGRSGKFTRAPWPPHSA